jgi:phosphatidylglycerophosphatase A
MKAQFRHLRQPSCALALSFGAGLSPWTPGSVGALVAFPLFAILRDMPLPLIVVVLTVFTAVGCFACGKTSRILEQQDHGAIVWDETVGMLLVLLSVPAGPWWWLLAFLAFRLFDIVKPWPIRLADVYTQGGVAVMLDDVLAALYAIAAIWFGYAVLLPGFKAL